MVKWLVSLVVAIGLLFAPKTGRACADPVLYGAFPNDGFDDGYGIRQALIAEDHVCLGSGVWELEYLTGTRSVTILSGQSVSGLGASTIVRQHGDGHLGTWVAFALQGGELRDLALYQDAWNLDPGGQTHMVQVEDSDGSRLSHLLLGPGSVGAGDCIRLLGNTNALAHLQVTNVFTSGCYRSGISVQHGVVSATVSDSVFLATHGQGVDYEPTSAGPVLITWTGNVMAGSGLALTMSDKGENGSVFKGNLILGNVQAVRATNVLFEGNTVLGDTSYVGPTFQVVGGSTGLRLIGNYLSRPAGAPASYVVQLMGQSSLYPSHALISGNRLVQNTQSQAIQTEGLTYALISENDITMVAWATGWAVSCRSIGVACDALVIANNLVSSASTTSAAFEVAGYSTNSVGRVLLLGNIATGFTYGLRCDPPWAGPISTTNNLIGANLGGC